MRACEVVQEGRGSRRPVVNGTESNGAVPVQWCVGSASCPAVHRLTGCPGPLFSEPFRMGRPVSPPEVRDVSGRERWAMWKVTRKTVPGKACAVSSAHQVVPPVNAY